MKKILLFSFSLMVFYTAANAQSDASVALAKKIADKMKDSLLLTPSQRGIIFQINRRLHEQKMQERKKNNDRSTIGKNLQKIENTRDLLYAKVLDEKQYALYKQKKRGIVNNN